ncbi:hypothetical protein BC628DRAFT_1384029 [Trametes gibbosa]|nr:hypothetical protein BC628DRAFT_1384029 [Trametes gibbosa]
MPSPAHNPTESSPALGHVNLMVDTLIANASLNDLQAFIRTTLATSPPSVAGTFTASARHHLAKTTVAALPAPETLFAQIADGGDSRWEPTPELDTVLARSRMLYGAGMGLPSLVVLTEVVKAAIGLRWTEGSRMEGLLSDIDADLTQAIQSTKERIDGGQLEEAIKARDVRGSLHLALMEDKKDVEGWDGDFPFERALASVELWNL